ncbi:MAG TPA: type I-E CRISPR-associated protein Cse2/CasB [Methylomirabilota bacterium]|nr:type I-E CRISPR-associated protein Cse2/CasB [Methylomirabilota bacterium]
MNASIESSTTENDFVRQLLAIAKREDRGMLADLKKGLSHATRGKALQTLGRLGAFRGNFPLEIFQTVGALFALHPKHAPIGNLGVTCRHVAKDREEAFDRRFRRLLACDTLDDLCGQLPGIVKMAKSADKLVDYDQLFTDLNRFRFNPQRVKIDWARRYWGAGEKEESAETAEAAQ